MATASAYLALAERAIRHYRRPLTIAEIILFGNENKLLPDTFRGLTPHKTIESKLSVHIRTLGQESLFIRTRPRTFFLRDMLDSADKVYEAPPWQPRRLEESVMAIPRSALPQRLWQGVRSVRSREDAISLLRMDQAESIPRRLAERDLDYKQLIVYVTVRLGDRILAYRRGVHNHSADMLRGSECVGFGGHVAASDPTIFDTDSLSSAMNAAGRELTEELQLSDDEKALLLGGEPPLEILGILNDDSSDVGRKHIALVLGYAPPQSERWSEPKGRELSIADVRWIDTKDTSVRLDDFEYWSQLVLTKYYPDFVRAQGSFRRIRKRPFAPPHLLCLVGEIGSGKSTAAATLREDFGYLEVNTGQIMADLLQVPPVPLTARAKFQELAQSFITQRNGPSLLAEEIFRRATAHGPGLVLVDGIRQLDTLRILKDLARDSRWRTPVLYIRATPDVAWRFYKSREGRGHDFFDFIKVRSSPVEREVRLMLAQADAIIYNRFGRGRFAESLRGILRMDE